MPLVSPVDKMEIGPDLACSSLCRFHTEIRIRIGEQIRSKKLWAETIGLDSSRDGKFFQGTMGPDLVPKKNKFHGDKPPRKAQIPHTDLQLQRPQEIVFSNIIQARNILLVSLSRLTRDLVAGYYVCGFKSIATHNSYTVRADTQHARTFTLHVSFQK